MRSKNVTLRPVDIPIALRLAERPDSTYEALSKDLGISTSTAHEALQRLALAGLIHPHRRRVNRSALFEFIEHGVRYAFPARPGLRVVTGIPTAHTAPVLASEIIAGDPVVWPDPEGTVEGEALEPLYDKAIELPERCPSVYEMLTLVDALRVGRARERQIAMAKLRERLGRPNARDEAAIRTALETEIEPGLTIRHADAPAFVALKLAAFRDRGVDDPHASTDLEDVLALVASRPRIIEEVATAPQDVRRFIAERVLALVDMEEFEDLVGGHLGNVARDRAARVIPLTEDRLTQIAHL